MKLFITNASLAAELFKSEVKVSMKYPDILLDYISWFILENYNLYNHKMCPNTYRIEKAGFLVRLKRLGLTKVEVEIGHNIYHILFK